MLTGPGGVGKGTLARKLVEVVPRLHLSVSWTTRPRRPGEPEEAYVFVSREEFEKRIREGGFLEWAEFLGNLYGTPDVPPPEGYDVLLEIEVQGARQVLERAKDRATMVLVVPPSEEELKKRMEARGDTPEVIAQRIEVGRREIDLGKKIASYVVVNDDLDRCVSEVAGIISAVRTQKGRL